MEVASVQNYFTWLPIEGKVASKKNEAKSQREKNLGNSQAYRDQALRLLSGNTDSKTLDYQRTNPREYQIVRTHTKETTWIQASHNNQ